ncbi:MAG TPA: radical SAM protein, partial [Ruminococcaceae bacterium]|nr:radical SAM protein [Oscillospiraceae bacterium]HBQ46504.1 radical SAM protein [Oscillospiraceae bacterium]HBT90347.1 radical SAM protein [Oscillospiraceae bacterium]
TDLVHPEDVDSLTAKCVPAAKEWAKVSQELWSQSDAKERCAKREEKEREEKQKIAEKVSRRA